MRRPTRQTLESRFLEADPRKVFPGRMTAGNSEDGCWNNFGAITEAV